MEIKLEDIVFETYSDGIAGTFNRVYATHKPTVIRVMSDKCRFTKENKEECMRLIKEQHGKADKYPS